MLLNEFMQLLIWVPVVTLASMALVVSYLDIKCQWVDHEIWGMFLSINIPILMFMYIVQYFPLELLALSLGAVVFWFVLMKLGAFQGADFVFLSMISIFFVQNPISGRVLMPLVLFEMLMLCSVAAMIVFWIFRVKMERVPFIPVISLAFLLTVVLG